MSALELKIPPPVVVLIVASTMWWATFLTPTLTSSIDFRTVASVILFVIGAVTTVAGVVEFRRARTTVDPTDPGKATSIVTSGVYRVTRNPMYLGLLFVLVGWAVYLSNLVALAGPILFMLYMNRFQIVPEERILKARFGAEYETYLSTVRRWL